MTRPRMYCHGHNNMRADGGGGGKGEEDGRDTPWHPLFTVTRSKLDVAALATWCRLANGLCLGVGGNAHTHKKTHIDTAYLRNSCRQVSQKRWPQVDTWTGSRIALLQSGHWKRLLGFSRNL